MRMADRKLWVGLLILVAVTFISSAAVMGGIEWTFASLGVMVLIGVTSIVIYVLRKALRRSYPSLKGRCPVCGSMCAVSFTGDDLKQVTYGKSAKADLITKEDKRIIMELVDDFFAKGRQQNRAEPVKAEPINEEDEKIIMEHVDELFTNGHEQSRGKSS